MPFKFALFTAIPLLAAGTTAHARGETMPAFGGDGPLYRVVTAVCPNGQYLVGFKGRTGAWIDGFKIQCKQRSFPHPSTVPVLGNTVDGENFGSSSGGSFEWELCPLNGAITAIDFNTVREDEDRVINKIIATCRTIHNYDETGQFLFGENDGVGNLQSYCPVSKYAIGVAGKVHPHGYPGRIGLICAKRNE